MRGADWSNLEARRPEACCASSPTLPSSELSKSNDMAATWPTRPRRTANTNTNDDDHTNVTFSKTITLHSIPVVVDFVGVSRWG